MFNILNRSLTTWDDETLESDETLAGMSNYTEIKIYLDWNDY